jgi:hypothetical protein
VTNVSECEYHENAITYQGKPLNSSIRLVRRIRVHGSRPTLVGQIDRILGSRPRSLGQPQDATQAGGIDDKDVGLRVEVASTGLLRIARATTPATKLALGSDADGTFTVGSFIPTICALVTVHLFAAGSVSANFVLVCRILSVPCPLVVISVLLHFILQTVIPIIIVVIHNPARSTITRGNSSILVLLFIILYTFAAIITVVEVVFDTFVFERCCHNRGHAKGRRTRLGATLGGHAGGSSDSRGTCDMAGSSGSRGRKDGGLDANEGTTMLGSNRGMRLRRDNLRVSKSVSI